MDARTVESPREALDAALGRLQEARGLLERQFAGEALISRLQSGIRYLELLRPEIPGGSREEENAEEVELVPRILPFDDLLRPVSPENPGGENLRLSGELNELAALTVNRARRPDFQPQWGESVQRALELLSKRSKDLAVAVRLVEGLVMTHGFQGASEGLALVLRLLDGFWEQLYPPAEDGDLEPRAEELARLQDGLVARLTARYGPPHEYAPELPDREAAAREKESFSVLLAQAEALIRWVDTRFQDEAPNLSRMQKTLEGYQRKVLEVCRSYTEREEAAASEEAAAVAGEIGGAVAAAVAQAAEEARLAALARIPEEPQSVDDACSRLDRCARYLVGELPADPLSYHVLRARRWFTATFDRSAAGAPSSEDRQRIGGLLAAQDWGGLLAGCEEVFARGGHDWLDLQRFAHGAAASLGAEYERVAETIASQVVEYLEANEELPESQLPDLTPAASAETREWLVGQRRSRRPGAPAVAPGESGPAAEVESVVAEARRLARKGEAGRAMELLMERERGAGSGREKFLWRLHLAELCVACQLAQVALPSIEDLRRQIDEFRLEEWESKDLLCRVLEAGLQAYSRAAGSDGALAEKVQAYRSRLMRLDPIKGLKWNEAAGGSPG